MMTPKLHDEMMFLVDKAGRTGLSSNVPFSEAQFSELVKLRQLSISNTAKRNILMNISEIIL